MRSPFSKEDSIIQELKKFKPKANPSMNTDDRLSTAHASYSMYMTDRQRKKLKEQQQMILMNQEKAATMAQYSVPGLGSERNQPFSMRIIDGADAAEHSLGNQSGSRISSRQKYVQQTNSTTDTK